MNKLIQRVIFVSAITTVALFPSIACSDTIYLKNGARVDGTILSDTNDKISLQIDGGTVEFNRSEISKVEKNSENGISKTAVGSQNTKNPSNDLPNQKTYNQPLYHYSINYPGDWQMKEKDAGGVYFLLMSPAKKFQAMVEISINDSPGKIGPEYSHAMLITAAKSASADFKLLSEGSMDANHQKLAFIIFNYNQGGRSTTSKYYYAASKSTGYIISYDSPAENFDKYLSQADGIVKSFKIT